MAGIKITLECDGCLTEFSKTVHCGADNNVDIESVINEAREQGWHIGLRTLCKECKELEFIKRYKCVECESFSRNNIGKVICTRNDKKIEILEDDYCEYWKKRSV